MQYKGTFILSSLVNHVNLQFTRFYSLANIKTAESAVASIVANLKTLSNSDKNTNPPDDIAGGFFLLISE